MSLLSKSDRDKIVSEALDPDKVVLECGIHHWVYGSKRQPTPGCKQCWMASFLGLIANTPPNKRQEVMDMLEYSVHQLVQADKEGRIDRIKLFKRPEVTIEKDASS